MKVLMLNSSDSAGGAARAACRLHNGLRTIGVESGMLVRNKGGDDHAVLGPPSEMGKILGMLRPHLDFLPLKLYPRRKRIIFSPSVVPDRVAARVARLDPDIVHLHWICEGFLRLETLKRIGRPIVWTLHDSWAFTGGCHLPFDCTRYRECCGACPQLGSVREADLSRRVWKRKKRSWQGLAMALVSPSRWLADCARSSALFKDARVEVIPNGLDLKRFKPFDKRIARGLLFLPSDKKLILFGGVGVTSDRNKGFELLRSALGELARGDLGDTTELVIFGASEPKDRPDLGMKSHYLGRLNDEVSLALLYAAADVFVAPSIQENLPNTVMESMACGTPCVAFDQGGLPDLIEHGRSGYLARPFDYADLAAGIVWVLEDSARWESLSREAAWKIAQDFGIEKTARRYASLYEEMLAK